LVTEGRSHSALLFGGSGFLGAAIAKQLKEKGWLVTTAGHSSNSSADILTSDLTWPDRLVATGAQFDAIVWAQGLNAKGSFLESTSSELEELFEVNVSLIARSLRMLVESGLLNSPCRGVVVSSVWQETARAEKFSYVTTKAALAGLVPSIAIDMGPLGFTINAVLPGVILSPMSEANLSQSQLSGVQLATPGGNLATAQEVANVVEWLASPNSRGVNSQSIKVDNGWSHSRHV